MRLLIDSHVYVWLLYSPERLGAGALEVLASAESVSLSSVSLWELALKHSKGRLPHSPTELTQGVEALGVEELPITHRHLVTLPTIDLPHGDPFDAMLAAQSAADDLILVTADGHLLASTYTTLDARR